MDPSGRLAGAQPAFATLGGAMGPITAGAVADAVGYGRLGWFINALMLIAASLMAVATLRADRLRSTKSVEGKSVEGKSVGGGAA
jgi:MFS family permease